MGCNSGGQVKAVDEILHIAGTVAHELALFAAIGFLIGGLDDLVVDLLWWARTLWQRLRIGARNPRRTVATLPPPDAPGWLAVFVPAWDEADVIGHMLEAALGRFDHPDYRIYAGCYPNDPATEDAIAAIAARDTRVRLVIGPRDGPTTKADCLNAMWRALLQDEQARGQRAKAIVLHDAEDVVHPQELRLFDRMIERYALVQIPVLPLIVPGSRWISGHYLDEFAEAHGKQLVVREAVGASVPAAGVGCAFERSMLERIAGDRVEGPFDADSLTEDYELGLRINALGGTGAFVRLREAEGAGLVAVRAYFPADLDAAVRQKSRWITGIALLGWERLGWRGGPAEFWMRMRDRRALLAALTLATGYLTALIGGFVLIASLIVDRPIKTPEPALLLLLKINAAMLLWRMLMRGLFVGRAHGWREGLQAVPRTMIGNMIAILATWRALLRYLTMKRGATPRWDKTVHVFPDIHLTP